MKKKYILALFLFLVFILGSYYVANEAKTVDVKEVFSTAALKSNCIIKEIKEENEKYKIEVYYPVTNYKPLNNVIKEKIEKQISDFKKEIDEMQDLKLSGQRQLIVNFDSSEYENYISFIFHSFIDLAGAHPNTYIWNINYNISTNKVITIDDFVNNNSNILKVFSEISYNTLKENSAIKEYGNEEMLKDGTLPKKENFQNFAFDKQGINLFFEKYAVAPYVAGEFCVCIPYDKIK